MPSFKPTTSLPECHLLNFNALMRQDFSVFPSFSFFLLFLLLLPIFIHFSLHEGRKHTVMLLSRPRPSHLYCIIMSFFSPLTRRALVARVIYGPTRGKVHGMQISGAV